MCARPPCTPALQVRSAIFSPDGSLLAAAGATSSIHVWRNPRDMDKAFELKHDGTVNTLGFTPDRRAPPCASRCNSSRRTVHRETMSERASARERGGWYRAPR